MKLTDIEFPDGKSIRRFAKENGINFGILAGGSTAALATSSTPLSSAIIPPVAAAYLIGHTEKLLTPVGRSIKAYQEDWDESELHQWAFLRTSDGLLQVIDPFVSENLQELARNDVDEFVRVLETLFENDGTALREIEEQLESVFIGDSDADGGDLGEIIFKLREIFDVANDNEAVHLYFLYKQLLSDLAKENGSESATNELLGQLEETTSKLVDEIVEIGLENQNFTQLTVKDLNARTPFQNKTPLQSWVYGFTFVEIAARTEDGSPYYFKHYLDSRSPAEPDERLNSIKSVDKGASYSDSWSNSNNSEGQSLTAVDESPASGPFIREDFEYFSDYLINQLKIQNHRIITGGPGAGKSVLCKRIAFRWFDLQIGPVFYRESSSDQPFTNVAELKRAITSSQNQGNGHVLIVVEDVTREDARRIFDVMEDCREKRNVDVTFLFDSRKREWADFVDSQQRYPWIEKTNSEYLVEEEIPPLAQKTVAEAIQIYNKIGHTQVPLKRSKPIYREVTEEISDVPPPKNGSERIQDEVLTMVSMILHAGEAEAESPLLRDAAETHQRLLDGINHGGAKAPRRYQLAIAINILIASETPIRRAYLYALAENKQDILTLERLLREDELIHGNMVLPDQDAPQITETRHASWSSAFLLSVIDSDDTRAKSIVKDTFQFVLKRISRLADSDTHRSLVREHLQDRASSNISLSKTESDEITETIRNVLTSIYKYGHLAPEALELFTEPDLETPVTDPSVFPDAIGEYTRYKILQIRAQAAQKGYKEDRGVTLEIAKAHLDALITSTDDDEATLSKEYKIVVEVAYRDFAKLAEDQDEFEPAANAYYQFIHFSRSLGHYLSPTFYISFSKCLLRVDNVSPTVDVGEIREHAQDRLDRGDDTTKSKRRELLKSIADTAYCEGNYDAAAGLYTDIINSTADPIGAESSLILSDIHLQKAPDDSHDDVASICAELYSVSETYMACNKKGAAVALLSYIAKQQASVDNTKTAIEVFDEVTSLVSNLYPDELSAYSDRIELKGLESTRQLLESLQAHGEIMDRYNRPPEMGADVTDYFRQS